MSWGAVSDRLSSEELADEAHKETFISEAAAGGLLLVDVPRPRATVRGRLGLLVEGAIERALEARGAPPPGPAALRDRDGCLADQIRRAHTSGSTGLAIWFSPLADIAVHGALDAEDSGAIRFWIAAESELPIRVGFDSANLRCEVYLPPVTLASILVEAARPDDFPEESSAEPPSDVESAPSPSTNVVETTATEDGHTTTTMVAGAPPVVAEDGREEADPESALAESARAMAESIGENSETGWLREALLELSTPPPRPAALDEEDTDGTAAPAIAEEPVRSAETAPPLHIRFAAEDDAPAAPVPAPKKMEIDAETRRQLEACARELRAASGPKPLAVVERLFQNAYVPLRSALDRGAELPSLRETADEWAKSFEKSYVDAFDALRVRTKRPAMVVDVPEIALRVARLHGARATQLLLVDGLRYDLGDRMNESLRGLVGQRAACAERYLLWSALPTTTAVQLELIGRGASGLREFTGEVSEDLVVARGRKASMIRRLKTGHREVLKLDVVEAHLGEPGGADPAGFDGVVDEVAQRIAAHFEGLQPRTLVMVFGDHGFRLPRDGDDPGKARSGGASPEEVLVPAFAWLVGAVH